MESGFLHDFPALSIPESWKEICWLSHSWRLFILLPHLEKKSRKPTRSLEVLSHSKIKALWSDESLEIVFILHLALTSFFLEALVKNYIWAQFCHTAKFLQHVFRWTNYFVYSILQSQDLSHHFEEDLGEELCQ